MLKSCIGLSRSLARCSRCQSVFSGRHYSNGSRTNSSSLTAGLVERGRALTTEHNTLKDKLANNYNGQTAKRIGDLSRVANAFNNWHSSTQSLQELEKLLKDPSSDAEIRSLAHDELESTSRDVDHAAEALKIALAPEHPFATLPCLIEIRPGVGGSEAGIFAAELLRMYAAYCRRHGLRTETVSLSIDETASGTEQVSEAIMEVSAKGAYDQLRCEAGVHRVQRVPATESKGRVHTSTASVLVLPMFPETSNEDLDVDDPTSDYYIRPTDVRTDVMRARGAGGQHVNTTDSAVRLTHMPTGTVVAVQTSRSQQQNRARAWQILRSRISQQRREAREAEIAAVRRGIAGKGRSDRSDKIRTYNWSQRRVTDHRSSYTTHALDEIIEGGSALDTLMATVRAWMLDGELEALTLEESA